MIVFLICLISQFSTRYENFVNSSTSDSIFVGLTRGNYEIADFAHDPVVLWFWRSSSGNVQADSLLKANHLRKNFHLAAVLRWEAKKIDNYETKLNKLHLAAYLDSSAIENFLSLISLGLKYRDIKPMKTAFSLPVFSDFRSQIFMITNLGILLFATIFMCGIVYILVKVVYYLPALSHQIMPKTHVQIIDIIKSLILLTPILILRNLYLIFICYSILLLLILSNREKNWLRFNIFILILIFITSLILNNFIAFIKGYNNHYQFYEVIHYDSLGNPEADNDKEKEFLAYGLKQQGELEAALSLYEDLYYRGYQSIAVINNLANIYFLYDESIRAESLYNSATSLTDRGEPYFNLGLLKLKNIEYAESARLMEEARKRNFSSLRKEPVDIKPSNNYFYKCVFLDNLTLNGFIKYIYVLPIVLILMFSFLPLTFSPPFYCTSCGRPVCEKCLTEINEETMCKECFTKFKSTNQVELEKSLRRSVDINRKKITKSILYIINIIIPGAGLIYLKKHLVGIILVCITMIGYVPVLFPKIFVKPTGWVTLQLDSIILPIALIIAFISYIISFALIWGYHAD